MRVEMEEPAVQAIDVPGQYRSLDAARIVSTMETLRNRISERFPGSGLSRVATDLLGVVSDAQTTARRLAEPHWPLRIAVTAGIVAIAVAGAAAGAFSSLDIRVAAFSTLAELFQGVDAAINTLVLLCVALFFLYTLESRWKRKRALAALQVLRSMAHIIDMHQLTKDPDRVSEGVPDTRSSPKRTLTPFELARYLDYCSELLAIVSKVAALYVRDLSDAATVSAVNEVEDLTSGLSGKIWQKIMILDRVVARP